MERDPWGRGEAHSITAAEDAGSSGLKGETEGSPAPLGEALYAEKHDTC